MKEIKPIRILRWTLACLIVFMSISYLFGTGFFYAKAESGSITVTNISTESYEFNTAQSGYTDYGRLRVLPDTYSTIESIKITAATFKSFSFTHDFESTSFTTNSSGSGYAWYDKNASAIYWAFYNQPATGEIIITYNKYIFVNITGSASNVSTTDPMDSKHFCFFNDFGTFDCSGDKYEVQTTTTTTDYYNVSYIGNNFLINVTKGSINSKWFLNSSNSSSYTLESSFNRVPFTFLHYNNGLIAKVCILNGDCSSKLINSSGLVSGQGQISFEKSSYSVGEFPVIAWSLSNSNSSYEYYLLLTNPIGNSITLLSTIPISGSTTSLTSFDIAGTWKASIIALDKTCTLPTFFCWLPGDIVAGYTQVLSSQPFLVANITTNKTTYGFRETWNFTVKASGSNKYVIHAYDPNGLLFAVFPGTEVLGNQTILYSPISYTVNGTWTAKVYDIVNARYVAEVKYQIVPTLNGYYVGQLRIIEEKINLKEQNYFIVNYFTVDYTSNGSGIISILKPDQSVFSTISVANGTGKLIVSIPTDSPLGYWTATLVDQSAVYSDQVMVTRNGTVVSQNGTFVVFADKTTYNRLEIVKATYKFPANFDNLSLVLYDANSKIVATAKLPPPEQQLFGYATATIGTTGTSGIWTLALEDNNNVRRASTTFSVSSSAVLTPTPTPKTIQENTNALLSGNLVAILLIMFSFLGIGYEIGGFMGSVIGFGSGFIVLGVLQLVPQWSLFLFAIVVITAFAAMAGKTLVSSGGGND